MSASSPEEPLLAADGRRPGPRGRETRERLLVATAGMLASRSYREVTVVDIARQVGASPATFYQYFPDVESAVLVLARRVVESAAVLTAPLEHATWRRSSATDAAALVDAFLAFWLEHAAVMRLFDLAVVEGDVRFRDLRDELLAPVTGSLAAAIALHRRDEVTPAAEAVALVAMLAHVAEHQHRLGPGGVALDAVRRSLTEHVRWGVTGRQGRR